MPCVRKAGPCESAATKAEEWRIRQSMACIGRGGVGVQWQGVDGVVEMGAWDVGEAVKVTLTSKAEYE